MREISKEELSQILERHRQWRNLESGGERANLRGANLRDADLCGANLCGANLRDADLCDADLRGADLRDADLCGADLRDADLCDADLRGADLRGADLRDASAWGTAGNLKHLKSIFLDTYQITYTAEILQIGCQRHPISEWWEFSDEKIHAMDRGTSLAWWQKYKPLLQQIIALSPAEPTGFVAKPETEAA